MRIGLTMRVVAPEAYWDPRDAISHDWLRMLDACGVDMTCLPNMPDTASARLQSANVDLLVLTGGEDMRVRPHAAVPPHQEGDPWVQRDLAEVVYLDTALAEGIPVFGVCRGMQLINCYLGGDLTTLPDAGTHRAMEHPVNFCECTFAEVWRNKQLTVNSFHDTAVSPDNLASDLIAVAQAGDGTVEACRYRTRPVAAVMWHPERHFANAVAAAAHGGDFWQRVLDSLVQGQP